MKRDEPTPKKTLGQHWLKDLASLEAICEAADVKAGDEVLEIGPGTGTLTEVLLSKQATVTAIEVDETLAANLSNRFHGRGFYLKNEDIRKFDFTQIGANYKLVANIPYYLTAYLLRLLIDTTNKPAIASLLVQKEVAERVAGRPGNMSFISVAVQLYYQVGLGNLVPAVLFTPPPKVDSQILKLTKLEKTLFDSDSLTALKFIKVGFSQPRKTLANNLSSGLTQPRLTIEKWLDRADLKPTVRAQELSLGDWHKLYEISRADDYR